MAAVAERLRRVVMMNTACGEKNFLMCSPTFPPGSLAGLSGQQGNIPTDVVHVRMAGSMKHVWAGLQAG